MLGAHVQQQSVAPGVHGRALRARVLARKMNVIVIPRVAHYFAAQHAPSPLVHRTHPFEQLRHLVALHV